MPETSKRARTMTFGQRLNFFRELNNLSMTQLAGMAGITVTYLSRVERGEDEGGLHPPSCEVVTSLCDALGIDDRPMLELALNERMKLKGFDLLVVPSDREDLDLYQIVFERETLIDELNIQITALKDENRKLNRMDRQERRRAS